MVPLRLLVGEEAAGGPLEELVFFDHPRSPRPLWVALAAPLTVLANTKDIGFSALLMLLNMVLWFSVLNALLTGIGLIFEKPRARIDRPR